jgi:hypothetical protein
LQGTVLKSNSESLSILTLTSLSVEKTHPYWFYICGEITINKQYAAKDLYFPFF